MNFGYFGCRNLSSLNFQGRVWCFWHQRLLKIGFGHRSLERMESFFFKKKGKHGLERESVCDKRNKNILVFRAAPRWCILKRDHL